LPALARCLEETNTTVFLRALDAIQQIDVKYPEVIPVLTKRLTTDDKRIRYAAATALASRGSEARSAVSALIKALKDPDKDIREAAARALIRIDPDTAAKAGAERPTGESGGGSASKVAVNFKNAPVSVVLEFYESLSGAKLVMQLNPQIIPGQVTLQPVKSLTRVEAMVAIESALLDQANVELKHIDNKYVSVSLKNPKAR